jgi:hypothetical protein
MKTLMSILFVMFASIAITAQSTSFTYQGHLNNGDTAANGNYDFEFRLFDALSGGAQQGATAQRLNVTVTGGIFTVQLDFGNNFPGADRFLDIAVRSAGGPSFTGLSPRQQLSSAPYAVKSLNSATADLATNATQLGGLGANQFVQTSDTRLTDARTPTAGSNSYIQNSLVTQLGASFNVSGNGTVGGILSGGTVNASTQYNIGGQRVLSNGGSSNIFTGTGTGTSITTGNNNAFYGSSSGDSTTTGSLNAFFGSNAGQANVSGGNNSFFGYHSGFNSTGNNNSFFGSNAGTNNSTGFNNSIFGKDAGFNSGASNNNAFFGYIAGFNNSTGNFNSFVGSGSGQSNLSGTYNSFYGYNAGRDNTNGNENTFVGNSSGQNNSSGQENTFVGDDAGSNNTSGNVNAFFGYAAGISNITGGGNTIVGAGADVLNSNLINATAIGENAGVAQSNSLVLGSIIGVNGASSDTKVGIGTATPSERLTIQTASNSYGWVHTQGTITMGSYVGGTGGQPFGGWIGTKSNHPLSFFTNNGGAAMTLETSGFLRLNNVDAGGSLSLCLGPSNHISFCSSSLRYKTNIAPFTPGLSLLKQLRPITFNWKEGGMADLGFGAEDVAKINELLVIRNKKGEVEGVKYDRISTILVNSVKEQQEVIQQQQDRIDRLGAEIEALRGFICRRSRAAFCRAGQRTR